jgi:hypothetical protein
MDIVDQQPNARNQGGHKSCNTKIKWNAMDSRPKRRVLRRSISNKQHHWYGDEKGKDTQWHAEHDDASRNPGQEITPMKKRQSQETEPKKDWRQPYHNQRIGYISLADRGHIGA